MATQLLPSYGQQSKPPLLLFLNRQRVKNSRIPELYDNSSPWGFLNLPFATIQSSYKTIGRAGQHGMLTALGTVSLQHAVFL